MCTVKIREASPNEMEFLTDCMGQIPRVIGGSVIMPSLHVGKIEIRSRPTNDALSEEWARRVNEEFEGRGMEPILDVPSLEKQTRKPKRNKEVSRCST